MDEQESENILVTKWVPSQSALLKDERIVAFISHCGINSSQKSLYYGKPILCVPMFGDHMDMAQRIESGSGIILRKENLSDSKQFSTKLTQLLNDSEFSRNANRMSLSIFLNEASSLSNCLKNIPRNHSARSKHAKLSNRRREG